MYTYVLSLAERPATPCSLTAASYIIPFMFLSTNSAFTTGEGLAAAVLALPHLVPHMDLVRDNHIQEHYVPLLWDLNLGSCITEDQALEQMVQSFRDQSGKLEVLVSYLAFILGTAIDVKLTIEDLLDPLTPVKDALWHSVSEYILKFFCPVDVVVYDGEGNKVAEIKDDHIVSGSELVDLIVIGDEKLLFFRDPSLTFEVSGYADGTMDCHFARVDEEGTVQTVTNFFDVPVSTSTKLPRRQSPPR